MFRKFVKAILICLSTSSICFAANQDITKEPTPTSQWGKRGGAIGMVYDKHTDGFIPYLQGYNDWFTVGIGGAYKHEQTDTESWNEGFISGNVGVRGSLIERFYLSGGITGTWNPTSRNGFRDNRQIGAYLGFDYFLSEHLLLTTQIDVYTYERDELNAREHEVFKYGLIGLSYAF
ncbi:MAG: hypothetical protein P0S95_04725 [Rhabdochlamydiaceae bacterium]|nr:hypothetical protein [Candidatus Amphrikana amoebophyrae]